MKDAIDMELNKLKAMLPPVPDPLGLNNLVGGGAVNQTYCTCAVFLSGQFTKGSNQPPLGNPALLHEQENVMACNPLGSKQCTNKCLETVRLAIFFIEFSDKLIISFFAFIQIAKHLPNSPTILCGSIDRDVYKERAYLFIQDCDGKWVNTNLSAGREFCCKEGAPYKCPIA